MFGKRNGTQLPPPKRSGPAPMALPPAAHPAKEPPKQAPAAVKPAASNGAGGSRPHASEPPRAKIEAPVPAPVEPPKPKPVERKHSEEYYDIKTTVFNALIDTIDLTQLAKLDAEAAREEIRDIVSEIIQVKNVVMSIAEQEELLEDICNDVLGYGPLEPLLARDDIAAAIARVAFAAPGATMTVARCRGAGGELQRWSSRS